MRGRYLLLLVLVLAAGVVGTLYIIPSDSYIYLPDEARAADPLVTVPDEEEETTEDGIYIVDVLVRRASVLEELLPGLFEGATLVPEENLNPLGVSDAARRESSLQDMTKSQKIAAAVALRELGYDVKAEPSGVLVSQVDPDAPAAGELEIGDVIVAADGEEIRTTADLARHMENEVEAGDTVELTVRREGKTQSVRVGTTESADSGRPVFGILVEQEASIELPVDIEIDAGNIGGPSAGLAFALDIVDELGDDVDGGRKVVVTGTIDLDGAVGPIGGIKQKTIGAREADADVFIVPEENAAEARQHADDLRVVAVSNFDQALAALETPA
jgi:PDZ domain-containing protein